MTYTALGKVKTVASGGQSLGVSYDASGGRVRRRGPNEDVVTLGDAYERRVSKQGVTQSTTWRVEAGGRIVAEVVRAMGQGGLFGTTSRYLHDDALGSTVVVTRPSANGPVVVARASNDAWGRARSATDWKSWLTDAQAGAVGMGFTGYRAELDHGLVDARGRMYDPKIGRFTSPDPLVVGPYSGAAHNRYAYVGNRPLKFRDPTGWAAEDPSDEPEFEGGDAEGVFDRIKRDFDAKALLVFGNEGPKVEAYANDSWFGDLTIDDHPAWGLMRDQALAARDHVAGMVEAAKQIADDPAAAAVAVAQATVDDANAVLATYNKMAVAVAEGDFVGAFVASVEGAPAAYRLASALVPAGKAGTAAATKAIGGGRGAKALEGAAGGGTAARVGALREAIPADSRGRITMGVGVAEDASGARHVLVGTSEPRGYLRPGVTLAPGETIAPGLGHAEADIVNYAQQNGLRLLEVGATRPICPACAAAIEGAGARAVTPLKVP
jgi:RHS repeat-associated protein